MIGFEKLNFINMNNLGFKETNLIVKSASFRKESRGLHFNVDYPEKSDMLQNIVL
jgi:L-aspartate oxidase